MQWHVEQTMCISLRQTRPQLERRQGCCLVAAAIFPSRIWLLLQQQTVFVSWLFISHRLLSDKSSANSATIAEPQIRITEKWCDRRQLEAHASQSQLALLPLTPQHDIDNRCSFSLKSHKYGHIYYFQEHFSNITDNTLRIAMPRFHEKIIKLSLS